LKKAIFELIRRNDIFSFSFKEINGEPVYEIVDISSISMIDYHYFEENDENEVLDKILKDFRTPFDLEKGFPFL